jgi:hypothetical protein
MRQVQLVQQIVSSTRELGRLVPSASPILQQINDLVQDVQKKMVASRPPVDSQAPPV